jgi:hypothetical protein
LQWKNVISSRYELDPYVLLFNTVGDCNIFPFETENLPRDFWLQRVKMLQSPTVFEE